MFQISAHAKYTHFYKKLQYASIKNYMTFINMKNNHFLAYIYRCLENIGRFTM